VRKSSSLVTMIPAYDPLSDPLAPEYCAGAYTGYSFENCARNEMLMKQFGAKEGKPGVLPGAMKTGTTIVGMVCKDAVVLGADTRATTGPIVADKNCEKIHYLAPNMYCCGAGTAADTESVTSLISSKLALLRLNTQRQSRVVSALTMLRRHLYPYQGHIGAYLILGGYDINGPQLYMIHAHGSSDQLPYATMGSGSLAAVSILETNYKENMDVEDAVNLVRSAIRAGVMNDMGSGGHIDIVIVRRDGIEKRRNVELPKGAERVYRKPGGYNFARGTTVVVSKTVTPLKSASNKGMAELDPLLAGAEEEARARALQKADEEESRMA